MKTAPEVRGWFHNPVSSYFLLTDMTVQPLAQILFHNYCLPQQSKRHANLLAGLLRRWDTQWTDCVCASALVACEKVFLGKECWLREEPFGLISKFLLACYSHLFFGEKTWRQSLMHLYQKHLQRRLVTVTLSLALHHPISSQKPSLYGNSTHQCLHLHKIG